MLNLIYCVDNSGLFGRKNSLPWNFKEDLKYFKDITTNFNKINNEENIIVMGYNTWISLKKKLPNRINVVISSTLKQLQNSKNNDTNQPDYVYKTLDEFIDNCKKNNIFYNKNIFIIGGKKLISYTILKYNKLIKHVFINVIEHSFPQFLDDVILKIYSFNNFELSRLSHDSIYCLNNNDRKYYYIKFNQYINKNFNVNDVLNFVDQNNKILQNDNNHNNHNLYQYTILEDVQDVPLHYCNECDSIIKKPVARTDKCSLLCNDCLNTKCKCLFC